MRPLVHWGAHEYFGQGRRNRSGRCYELACLAILVGDAPDGTLLVHGAIDGGPGTVGRMGHAWLLLPDDRIWEPLFASYAPRDEFYAWARAEELAVYSRDQVDRFIRWRAHYGPWEAKAEVEPQRPQFAAKAQ